MACFQSRYFLFLIGYGFALGLALLLIGSLTVQGATYYLDNDGGNDSNTGLSQAAAWRTINKLNSTVLQPGDQVLFQRGDIWYEQLMIRNSGTAANPIFFGAYGDASTRPIVAGSERITSSTYRWNRSGKGTNEFYVTLADGNNPQFFSPTRVWLNEISLPSGLIGSASDHTWGYGDNEGLGFNTIYIRDDSGDPDETGVKIERNNWRYSVYSSTQQYVNFDSIIFEKATDYVFRIAISGGYMNVTNCSFRQSSGSMLRFSDAVNVNFRNCTFEKSYSFQSLVFIGGLNNVSTSRFEYCLFDDSSTYCVEMSNCNAVDFVNCFFIGPQSGHINNYSSGIASALNCVFTVPSKTSLSVQPFLNIGTGQIRTTNCSIMPNGMNPAGFNMAGVVQTDNIYQAPKIVSHRNRGIVTFNIDDTGNFTRWKAIADLAEQRGYRIGMALFTKTMTEQDWADARAYVARGHEIESHATSHAYLNLPDRGPIKKQLTKSTALQFDISTQ